MGKIKKIKVNNREIEDNLDEINIFLMKLILLFILKKNFVWLMSNFTSLLLQLKIKKIHLMNMIKIIF